MRSIARLRLLNFHNISVALNRADAASISPTYLAHGQMKRRCREMFDEERCGVEGAALSNHQGLFAPNLKRDRKRRLNFGIDAVKRGTFTTRGTNDTRTHLFNGPNRCVIVGTLQIAQPPRTPLYMLHDQLERTKGSQHYCGAIQQQSRANQPRQSCPTSLGELSLANSWRRWASTTSCTRFSLCLGT